MLTNSYFAFDSHFIFRNFINDFTSPYNVVCWASNCARVVFDQGRLARFCIARLLRHVPEGDEGDEGDEGYEGDEGDA